MTTTTRCPDCDSPAPHGTYFKMFVTRKADGKRVRYIERAFDMRLRHFSRETAAWLKGRLLDDRRYVAVEIVEDRA